jgi:hypothetical protein
MVESVAFACFVAGTVAFVRFFMLAPRLRRERTDPEAGKLQAGFPWLPGSFTPEGERLRRRMNGLLVVGWVFLIAGIVLSRV